MARKRLRPFLDEVITDVELHATVQNVSDARIPAPPESFPPPPWEKPPALTPLPGNGHADSASTATDTAAAVEVAPVDTAGVVALPTPMTDAPVADAAAAVAPPGRPHPTTPAHASTPVPATPPTHTPERAPSTAPLDPAAHGRRRRRSASLLPPLPSPTDVPEDAPGRVAILAVPLPPEATAEPHPPVQITTEPAPISTVGGEAPLAGWLPVLALGVALVLIFVAGVLVTR